MVRSGVCIMSPYTDDKTGPLISEELKAKFKKALEGRLELPNCRDCIRAQGFVQVVHFLIDGHLEAVSRMDRAAQVMEEFIELFRELEVRAMKERMNGEEGR